MNAAPARPGRRAGRLVGRRGLITEGGAGLAREVVVAFAREGADLAIGYRGDDPDAAETTAALARAEGARVVLLPGDLADEGVCTDVVDRAADRLGGLDTLVMIERIAHTNLATLRWLSGAALRHFRAGSAIIATSPLAMSSMVSPAVLQRMRRLGVRMRGVAPALALSHGDRLSAVFVELAATPRIARPRAAALTNPRPQPPRKEHR